MRQLEKKLYCLRFLILRPTTKRFILYYLFRFDLFSVHPISRLRFCQHSKTETLVRYLKPHRLKPSLAISINDTLLVAAFIPARWWKSVKEAEMSANWRNYLREELICHICQQVLVDPTRLPCRHDFCHTCITKTWSGIVGGVRCPECNMSYPMQPRVTRNLKLANIVDSFKALDALMTPAAVPSHSQAVCDTEVRWNHTRVSRLI